MYLTVTLYFSLHLFMGKPSSFLLRILPEAPQPAGAGKQYRFSSLSMTLAPAARKKHIPLRPV